MTGGISSHLRPVLCVGLLVKLISRRLSCENSSKRKEKKGITEMHVQPMLGLSLIYLFFFFVLVNFVKVLG